MEAASRLEAEGGRQEEAVMINKCNLLKRKCMEYEEMNNSLLARTKKIRCIIEKTEKEKSFLIKRLEQFEVLDEVPRSKFSPDPDSLPEVQDEKALLITAFRIRAEVNAELARLKSQCERDPKPSVAITSRQSAAVARSISPVSMAHVQHDNMSTTPLQSPVASIIVTPSSLVPAAIPTASNKSYSKVRKTKLSKGQGRTVKRKRPDVDPNAPKKPSNAFFWFCQEKRAFLQEQFRGEGMSGQHDLTKALAKLWSETASEEKKKYYHKYNADKARYDKEMKEYTSMVKQGSVDTDDTVKVEPMT